MKEIKNLKELITSIQTIEFERDEHLIDVKEHFRVCYKKINLENILSESIKKVFFKPVVADNIINTALSFFGGYISKKIIVGKSTNIFKNILGSIVQYGFSALVYQKPEIITIIRKSIESFFTTKKNDQ
jgi:hypothetical protein